MNKLNAITAFVAVAESSSFRVASERLHLSGSAITKLVQRLEESLKTQLLHRNPRTVVLTESGKQYYEHCSRILDELQMAEESLSNDESVMQGTIRLASSQGGTRYLTRHLNEFCAANPDINIDILVKNGYVDILQEGCDLWVTAETAKLNSIGLKRRFLAKLPIIIMASPNYLAKNGIPSSLDDLKDHVCVAWSRLASPVVWTCRSPHGSKAVKMRHRVAVSSGESLLDAALADLGLVCIPGLIAHAEITSGRLVRVLPEYEVGHRMLNAVYPANRYLSKKTIAFMDHIKKAIRLDTSDD